MIMDVEGDIWISGFNSPEAIQRVSPYGVDLSSITSSVGTLIQIRYGVSDMKDIYLVISPKVGGDSLKDGKMPCCGSLLYKGRSNIAGIVGPCAFFTF